MRLLTMADWWDKFFAPGIIATGFDGVLELVGGARLLFVAPERIKHVAVLVIQPELTEDPDDFIRSHPPRGRRAGKPCGPLCRLAIFVLDQLHQLTLTPSSGLAVLAVFDILIVVLTWHGYGGHRRRGKLEKQT